jgi:hypothetical protein
LVLFYTAFLEANRAMLGLMPARISGLAASGLTRQVEGPRTNFGARNVEIGRQGRVCERRRLGGSRIGQWKATAVLLVRQGAQIFGTDLREEAAAETLDLIRGEGGTCAVRACDMTSAAEVAECRAKFGRIDILVNNVGGSAPGNAATMAEEVWDAQLAHNLKTMFLACKFVLPVMEAQAGGAIINLSSIAGLRMSAERAHIAYSTAFGILAFSNRPRSSRQEGHSLQYGDPGAHEHAAGGASAGQDRCRWRSCKAHC